MIIQEKTTDVVPVTTEDTGVNAALAIVLVFALIAVIGIYAYVVNNGNSRPSSTYIERSNSTNTQTVQPVNIPTPVPVPTPVPSAPAPAAPAAPAPAAEPAPAAPAE